MRPTPIAAKSRFRGRHPSTNDPWKQKPSVAPSAISDISNPQSKQIQQTCRDVKALQTGFQAPGVNPIPADQIINLHEQYPGITMLAETSADEHAIAYFQRAAARKRLSFFTGAPCGTRIDCGQGRPLFGGVGALTSQRLRMPR